MFGFEASGGRGAFDRVETVHLYTGVHRTARRVVGSQLQKSRVPEAGEEVCIEREDDVSLIEPVLRIDVIAKGLLRGAAGGGTSGDRVRFWQRALRGVHGRDRPQATAPESLST